MRSSVAYDRLDAVCIRLREALQAAEFCREPLLLATIAQAFALALSYRSASGVPVSPPSGAVIATESDRGLADRSIQSNLDLQMCLIQLIEVADRIGERDAAIALNTAFLALGKSRGAPPE
jgi:hypothetical protein